MTDWQIIYDPFDPGPRRMQSDGYTLFLVAQSDEELVMAQADISGHALRLDMRDVDRSLVWPAVAKVAARDLAVYVRDGVRTEMGALLCIPVVGSHAAAAARAPIGLVPVEKGALIAKFDDA